MNGFIDLDFYKRYIEEISPEEMIKQGTIAHCREMDKADVYEWCASNEVKVYKLKLEIDRLNNIIDEARKYIENNQSGGNDKNGHFHINFDGDIWELYEMLRRF